METFQSLREAERTVLDVLADRDYKIYPEEIPGIINSLYSYVGEDEDRIDEVIPVIERLAANNPDFAEEWFGAVGEATKLNEAKLGKLAALAACALAAGISLISCTPATDMEVRAAEEEAKHRITLEFKVEDLQIPCMPTKPFKAQVDVPEGYHLVDVALLPIREGSGASWNSVTGPSENAWLGDKRDLKDGSLSCSCKGDEWGLLVFAFVADADGNIHRSLGNKFIMPNNLEVTLTEADLLGD